MTNLIKQNPIWSFLIINYIISWSFLYPSYRLILDNEGIPPLALIGLIGAYGPSIAAIIVEGIISKQSLRSLLKRLIKIRLGLRSYLFIILLPILLYILAYLITFSLFEGGDLIVNWKKGLSNIYFWVLVALPFGPMGEELGWRGFLLPRLLKIHSIFKSTLIVGLAWGIWHLASFTFPGAAIPEFLPVNIWTIVLFISYTIGLSFMYTYVHFKSGGSVFAAILLHAFLNAAANITSDFFTESENFNILLFSYILFLVLTALLGIVLIRKQLGLKLRDQEHEVVPE